MSKWWRGSIESASCGWEIAAKNSREHIRRSAQNLCAAASVPPQRERTRGCDGEDVCEGLSIDGVNREGHAYASMHSRALRPLRSTWSGHVVTVTLALRYTRRPAGPAPPCAAALVRPRRPRRGERWSRARVAGHPRESHPLETRHRAQGSMGRGSVTPS